MINKKIIMWYAIIEGKIGSDNNKVVNVTYDNYAGALKLMQSYIKDYPHKIYNLFVGLIV
ncbi:MAG: hypothetical protein IMZ51_03850 [Chloroflexi bacterium]|nr:hypothetical protein [Chloroflexota bacterium]